MQESFRSLALQSSWACSSPTPDHGATARPSLHLISPSHVRVHSNARCLSSSAACERLLKTQEQKLNDAQHVLSAWGGNSHQLPNVVAAVAECATQFPVSTLLALVVALNGITHKPSMVLCAGVDEDGQAVVLLRTVCLTAAGYPPSIARHSLLQGILSPRDKQFTGT